MLCVDEDERTMGMTRSEHVFFLVWHFKLLYRLYSVSFIKVSKIPGFRLNLLRDSVCVAWVFLRERFHGSQILNYFSVI